MTYGVGFVDIGRDHLAEDALASYVPDLHGDLDVARQFKPLDKEV